jgi:hypothetical protein
MPQERFLGLLRQRLNKPTAALASAEPGNDLGRMPLAAGSRA